MQKNLWNSHWHIATSVLMTAMLFGCAPKPTPVDRDSSLIDEHGTAHITRVIPIPTTVSAEAQKVLARHISDEAITEPMVEHRAKTDDWQTKTAEQARAKYP